MSNAYTILLVEDEANIAGFMTAILTANHYGVRRARDGAEAMMMVSSYCPDAVILDLGLPDVDGMDLIRKIREWSQIPIIVVSARTHERDKVSALDLGADDYITKPFGTSELLARVRTALRHARAGSIPNGAGQSGSFCAGRLRVDYDKRHVYLEEEDIHLTQNEYRIVALLAQYAGRVLTYDFLIKNIWGPNAAGDNQILRVNMANIRRKLEKNPAAPEYIFTEMGVGYRMIEGD
ncbi:MAG: response regulator transcription factor [Eubacteriales bacterium]|nr:response regulator transcription factor [Eubacteriales bacterium]